MTKRMDRLWNKYNEKLHSNKEKDKLLRPSKTQGNVTDTVLGKGSLAQNSTYYRIPFIWNLRVS